MITETTKDEDEKSEGSDGMKNILEKKCDEGHPLKAQRGRITAYKLVYCNDCLEENLNDHKLFYRCAPCKYDLCVDCATGAGTGGLDNY